MLVIVFLGVLIHKASSLPKLFTWLTVDLDSFLKSTRREDNHGSKGMRVRFLQTLYPSHDAGMNDNRVVTHHP